MKANNYWVFGVAVLVIFIIYEIQKEKPQDWTQTFHHNHSIPFGMKATHEIMPTMFDSNEIGSSFKTFYELINLDSINDNLLVICNEITLPKNDLEALFKHVESGKTVLIQSYDFKGTLADTFQIETAQDLDLPSMGFSSIERILGGEATEEILIKEQLNLDVPEILTSTYFSTYNDSLIRPLIKNSIGDPLVLEKEIGKGRLLLSTMPLSLTNYMVLNDQARLLSEFLLNNFPANEPLIHNEYYQLGRLEAQSPMRVVLSNLPLRIAFYVILILLLVLLFFESKRRQRMIPVVNLPKNSSLEFVDTLGQLYYRQSSHTKLAEKRMKYWVDHVVRHYNLRPHQWDNDFMGELSKKSGVDEKVCKTLIDHFIKVESEGAITADELQTIEKALNEFYGI